MMMSLSNSFREAQMKKDWKSNLRRTCRATPYVLQNVEPNLADAAPQAFWLCNCVCADPAIQLNIYLEVHILRSVRWRAKKTRCRSSASGAARPKSSCLGHSQLGCRSRRMRAGLYEVCGILSIQFWNSHSLEMSDSNLYQSAESTPFWVPIIANLNNGFCIYYIHQ